MSLPSFPAKILKKIREGDFVDVAELLRDNIEVEHRQGQVEGGCSSLISNSANKARRWEEPDILSWCQCFAIFVSMIAIMQPERVSQMLAYQAMLVWEARQCGGGGWKQYDSTF